MKTTVKLLFVVAISLAITAGILAVIDVRSTLGSGSASVRIPEDKIQIIDSNSITYMAFWHQNDAESMALRFSSEDEKYFRALEKKEDGLYVSIRTGSETPGSPFKKSRFYFQGYVVISTPRAVYLGHIERRGELYTIEIKTQKEKSQTANQRLQTMRFKLPINSTARGPHV
jgi:hypothetical protein